MAKSLFENPYMNQNLSQIITEFWDIHAGEADQLHITMMRKAVEEFVGNNPKHVHNVFLGYLQGKHYWDEFWNHCYASVPKFSPQLTDRVGINWDILFSAFCFLLHPNGY